MAENAVDPLLALPTPLPPLVPSTSAPKVSCGRGPLPFPGTLHRGGWSRNPRIVFALAGLAWNTVHAAVSFVALETCRSGRQDASVHAGGNRHAGAAIGRHGVTPWAQ